MTNTKGKQMDQDTKAGLGQRLSVLAKLKGLTQEEIANNCAISRISVNRFFRQRTEIRASDFKSLLSTLGIELDVIIDMAIEKQIHGQRSPAHMWRMQLSEGAITELKALP